MTEITTLDLTDKSVIQLQHTDIVPFSEVITLKGANQVALSREQDYLIDYKNGLIEFLTTGVIGTNPDRFREDVKIYYRFAVDFDNVATLKSHIQVFNESASLTAEEFEFTVQNSPIQSVQRVENLTTHEQYSILGFTDNTVLAAGGNPPVSEQLVNQTVDTTEIEIAGNRAIVTIALTLPEREELNAITNPVILLSSLQATTTKRRIIEGGTSESEHTLSITDNVSSFKLYTGAQLLRNANTTLLGTIDTTTDVGTIDYIYSTLSDRINIEFTNRGLTKIGTNNVYVEFFKDFTTSLVVELSNVSDPETAVNTTTFNELLFQENVSFTTLTESLSILPELTYVTAKQTTDLQVLPSVYVTNITGTQLFEEEVDYTIDFDNNTISIPLDSTIQLGDAVSILYKEPEEIKATYTFQAETVAIDYEFGNNTIDWTQSFTEESFAEIKTIRESIPYTVLSKTPADFNSILIYREGDIDKNVVAIPQKFDAETGELSFTNVTTPKRASGNIVFEYVAREQLLNPGDNYFVSYRYGARRDALMDNFATLLGIQDEGSFARTEVTSLGTRQSKAKITFPPTSTDEIVLYREGDPDQAPLTTVKSFNQITSEILFDPLISAENIAIKYRSSGYATEDLRKIVIGLIEAFLLGPTEAAISTLVNIFTDIEPNIVRTADLAFRASDRLNEIPPQESSRLSDDVRSIEFVPGRLNRALQVRSQNSAYVQLDAQSNLSTKEGTIEFLLSNLFEGDDNKTHYFFDWIGTDEATNRISIYKNSRNKLVFEIRDCNSSLYRVLTNIARINRIELFSLEKGATEVQLNYVPAHGIVNLNDSHAPDIFEAQPSEFLIHPVFEGSLKGCVLNITTLVKINKSLGYSDDPDLFADTAANLRSLATMYEKHNGKLTIHTELEFMQGCIGFDDNVLLDLQARGHEVGLFIDLSSTILSRSSQITYVADRLAFLRELGIRNILTSVSGGFEIVNYASTMMSLGLNVSAAYKDPLTGLGLTPKIVNPFRPSDIDFIEPDLNSNLIHVPGDIDIITSPLDSTAIVAITDSLENALDSVRFEFTNTWYWSFDVEDLGLGSLTTEEQLDLIDQWITDNVDSLNDNVPTSAPTAYVTPEWATFSKMRNKFISFEQWSSGLLSDTSVRDRDLLTSSAKLTDTTLSVDDASKFIRGDLIQINGEVMLVEQSLTHELKVKREANRTTARHHRARSSIAIFDNETLNELEQIRSHGITPTSFDANTMLLTFLPTPEAGIYVFDYIAGWSRFDETEHFIAATWKLHSDDCIPPFIHLFVDGRMVETVLFESLLEPREQSYGYEPGPEPDPYGYGYEPEPEPYGYDPPEPEPEPPIPPEPPQPGWLLGGNVGNKATSIVTPNGWLIGGSIGDKTTSAITPDGWLLGGSFGNKIVPTPTLPASWVTGGSK